MNSITVLVLLMESRRQQWLHEPLVMSFFNKAKLIVTVEGIAMISFIIAFLIVVLRWEKCYRKLMWTILIASCISSIFFILLRWLAYDVMLGIDSLDVVQVVMSIVFLSIWNAAYTFLGAVVGCSIVKLITKIQGPKKIL